MLLTITTTHKPATDLGYLLHKHPDRVQTFSFSFGQAHVFYPEASDARCTVALLLELDPVQLVRGGRPGVRGGGLLDAYVNDRPYVASSFMSVAIGHVLRTAMTGKSAERPDLAETTIPLEARLAVVPCRGGAGLLRRLFEPLGYAVGVAGVPLDEAHPAWGASRYFSLNLSAEGRLRDLLMHLYVLIPVLDDEKHYWVGRDEVEKLLQHGGQWLAAHPERELIVRRYLRHQAGLTREALRRLLDEDQADPDADAVAHAKAEEETEARVGLHEQRLARVAALLREHGAARVLDLGCGEGKLLQVLAKDRGFSELVGVDVSVRALEVARRRLRLDRPQSAQRARVRLLHGSLTYRDRRLEGYDAAAVVEVIEHLDPARLASFERVLFEFARPRIVVLTTPNAEYNVKFEGLPAGTFRHADHRFEWTRAEFAAWVAETGRRYEYAARIEPVGPEDPILGAPSQIAVFTRD
jgi:3' terminal RNA ribose 2'-O-methyltransferase Hen1